MDNYGNCQNLASFEIKTVTLIKDIVVNQLCNSLNGKLLQLLQYLEQIQIKWFQNMISVAAEPDF